MLHELRVENLLLMDRAELRLAPGLNVLTGETGAGKTLLAQALDLLLGGRAGSGIVRGGAAEAYVEGVFSRPPGLDPEIAERLPEDAEEIVLARRVWPDGRTRAYVCGRSATVADLRDLGGRLVAFYGQHEHRKLMLSTAQLDVLDAHCGIEQLALRERTAATYERVRELEHRIDELREMAGARERELDLLAFELDEIEAVDPSEDEEQRLTVDRDRLRHLETLRIAATTGAEAVSPDGGGGAAEMLAEAERQLELAAGIDPELSALCTRLQGLRYEAEDLGRELRHYVDGLEGDGAADAAGPERLEQIEERLALFARLQRKHGGALADVLAHADRCRARRDELEHAEIALESGEAELAAARAELDELAAGLRKRRAEAGPRLAEAVRERLAELAMPDASFEVALRDRPDGCGPRGADVVELMIAANPGVPAGPLREIASGGELSRVMLALLTVAHSESGDGETSPLLVFDEIDAGIGGHTARAVGEHLRELAAGRQLLCITHLPQVAALASRHFTIAKSTGTVPVTTTVTELGGDSIVGELVRMLGAGAGDRAAKQHARQLLRAAA
ncbi:MAG TPA: DNA repair protein RecN [Solirubrobacteraceae bacterium]